MIVIQVIDHMASSSYTIKINYILNSKCEPQEDSNINKERNGYDCYKKLVLRMVVERNG